MALPRSAPVSSKRASSSGFEITLRKTSKILTAFGCKMRVPLGLSILLFASATVSPSTAAAFSPSNSPIALENARSGSSDWILTDPADHEVEGYASATGIQRGDTLKLFIHSTDPAVSIAFYR